MITFINCLEFYSYLMLAGTLAAMNHPLLGGKNKIKKAKGIIINIIGDSTLSLKEVNGATDVIQNNASKNANVIFSVTNDEGLKDKIKIKIIATGFKK